MNHKEYMRYLERRIQEAKMQAENPNLFNLEKEQAKMKKDQEMFDQYMKSTTSFRGWFPEFEDVPIGWLIVGILSGLFLLIGVFL